MKTKSDNEKRKQEAKRLIKKIGLRDDEIAQLILCGQQSVLRWRTGQHAPRHGDLQRLRQLANEKRP